MKQLTLNFYDEKVLINLPNTLHELRQEISNQFLLNPIDTEELLLRTTFQNTKGIKEYFAIKTSWDYSYLLVEQPDLKEIFIDIHQDSNLYKESLSKVINPNRTIEDQLQEMKLETIELVNVEKAEYAQARNEYEIIKDQLEDMKKRVQQMNKEIRTRHSMQQKKIRSNRKLIKQLEEKLKNNNQSNEPLIMNHIDHKMNHRKKEERTLHKNIKCHGCDMFPIQGVRYKCSSCDNFDYCQKCREKFSYLHHHTFIAIPVASEIPDQLNIEFLAPYSSMNNNFKIIQCKYK